MRVSFEENKRLLINTILFIYSLVLILFQLFCLNYTFDESNVNLIWIVYEYLFLSNPAVIKEDIILIILINILVVLFIGSFVYYVFIVFSFLRKNQKVSIKTLIVFKSIYLLMIIFFLILHSVLPKTNSLMGYLLLLLVLLFAIYDLASTIRLFKNRINETQIKLRKFFIITKFIILSCSIIGTIVLVIAGLSII